MKARLLFVIFVLALAGCATRPPTSSSGSAHRVRCLYEPAERETRPLIFLFCIENP